MILTCCECQQEKDSLEFSKKNKSKRGFAYKCKSCHNTYVRESWYPKNKDKQIASSHKWRYQNSLKYKANKYGIDLESVKIANQKNDGSCQICRKETKLCLDHCHSSSKIRGFLCNNCNAGIGFLKDDVNILGAAIQYLKNFQNS